MIRLNNIKLELNETEDKLYSIACNMLHIKKEEIKELVIYKKSIDARDKNNIHFVYTLNLDILNEFRFKSRIIEDEKEDLKIEIKRKSKFRPVIVGAGPSGLFAALTLAENGFKPIILEQGKKVEERAKDVESFWKTGKLNTLSNVQFGEGGAGTFSDGKLVTQISNPLCRKVLREFCLCGAPKEIMYEAMPHIGTDKLIKVVKNIREKIEKLGGEFLFNEKLVDLSVEKSLLKGVICSKYIETDTVILAIGHSSRDTFEMLLKKEISMAKKPFSVGVRIEHKQADINKSQYGDSNLTSILGAATYKLAYHSKEGRGAYTFCMCPGGQVIAASSEEGTVVTNGMSKYLRNGENANSALLVSVMPEDFESDSPLAGMYFQRELEKKAFVYGGENYYAPVQLVQDFLSSKVSKKLGNVLPSYMPGTKFADFNEILPGFLVKTMKEALLDMDRKIKGFTSYDSVLTGVETRSSSPLRILRDENMMSSLKGLYPCGEGSGYAGGIMSSAVDGIKVAKSIIEKI